MIVSVSDHCLAFYFFCSGTSVVLLDTPWISRCRSTLFCRVLISCIQKLGRINDMFISDYPLAQQLGRGWRVCPESKYLRSMYRRKFTDFHRSSDRIYKSILILLHTSIWYDITSDELAFQDNRV